MTRCARVAIGWTCRRCHLGSESIQGVHTELVLTVCLHLLLELVFLFLELLGVLMGQFLPQYQGIHG